MRLYYFILDYLSVMVLSTALDFIIEVSNKFPSVRLLYVASVWLHSRSSVSLYLIWLLMVDFSLKCLTSQFCVVCWTMLVICFYSIDGFSRLTLNALSIVYKWYCFIDILIYVWVFLSSSKANNLRSSDWTWKNVLYLLNW